MRVAHMIGSLNRGGTEVLLLDVCRNVSHDAMNIIVVHRKEGGMFESFVETGTKMISLKPRSHWDIGYFLKLRSIIREQEIDVIHAHQNIDAMSALLSVIGTNVKIVLSVHGQGLEQGRVAAALRKFVFYGVDLLLFVSFKQHKEYAKRFTFTKRTIVLQNGVDFEKFSNKVTGSIRSELNIAPNELLLGSVGNFTNVRDQIVICRFLKLLAETNVQFKFLFVGAASSTESELYQNCVDYCLKNGISDKVFFLGGRSDVPNILPQLDAFVYSTIHDTFGISMVEAMAAGIPVFANDWEVMQEITNEGAWATLYASRSPHDLLIKFQNFFDNQSAYRERAILNSSAVRERYGMKKYLEELKAIYSTLFYK